MKGTYVRIVVNACDHVLHVCRNTLLFAIGFLVDENSNYDMFEQPLTKVAKMIIALEMEKEYLSLDANKTHLQARFAELYTQLSTKGEAFVRFDSANYLCLKLHSAYDELIPNKVNNYDVPIFITRNPYALSNLPWDISILHLVPFIDGFSCVQKISIDAAMDISCVKNCLRVLIYYNCILLSDFFEFANVYMLTPSVSSILSNSDALSSIQSFAALDANVMPNPSNILRFVLALRPGVSIGTMLQSKIKYNLQGIDLRKLLAILVSLKIIRRIRRYPVSNSNKTMDANFSGITLLAPSSSQAAPSGGKDESKPPVPVLKPRTSDSTFVFSGAQHIEEILVSRKNIRLNDLLKFSNVLFINK